MSKRVPADFEVRFHGGEISPEAISLTTLSRALSAVQRLASGEFPETEDEDDAVSLVAVRRGSARFECAARTPEAALANLRLAGSLLENSDRAEDIAYAFNPLEELSAIAKSLQCTIELRSAADRSDVLATIGPSTFANIAHSLLLEGDTTITGTVKRVGGTTEMRCALRVSFQHRLLFCRVANAEVARRLGERLYEEVAVSGTAKWIRNSWRVIGFLVKEIHQPKMGSLAEAFSALREAGGKGWDKISDPAGYLREVTGE